MNALRLLLHHVLGLDPVARADEGDQARGRAGERDPDARDPGDSEAHAPHIARREH